MRIVHTCLRYPPATGGAETYIQQIVERTRSVEKKRDVRVLTSAMRTHGPISYLKPESLTDDPVYIQRLSVSKTPILSYPRLDALSYYLGHHRPDIIEAYGFWYQPADVAARYAKKHKIPFIFHPIYYENSNRQKFSWQLYKKTIGRKTFEAADVVVVLSEFEKDLIEKAQLPTKRIEIIPPGIETVQLNTPHLNPFLKRGIKGQILLAVNRLAPGKKLEDAITALSLVLRHEENVQLALVGEDFGSQEEITTLAKDLGVLDHVHFLGKLSHQELAGAYQHANIFIHTSLYEAFGIVIAEALAAGLPVIGRNSSAIPYLIPHEERGLLFNDPAELAANIITYLQDPNYAKHLAKTGQQYVLSHFSWETSVNKLLRLYGEFAK